MRVAEPGNRERSDAEKQEIHWSSCLLWISTVLQNLDIMIWTTDENMCQAIAVRDLWQNMGLKNIISFVGSFGKPRRLKESLPNLTGRKMLTKLVIEILWISGTLTFHIMKEIEGHPHVAQSIPGVHCLSSAMLLTSLNVTAHKGET